MPIYPSINVCVAVVFPPTVICHYSVSSLFLTAPLLTLLPGAELFIAGESYAGFYIPWIAEHIVRSQLVPDARGDLVRDVELGACIFCLFLCVLFSNDLFLLLEPIHEVASIFTLQ